MSNPVMVTVFFEHGRFVDVVYSHKEAEKLRQHPTWDAYTLPLSEFKALTRDNSWATWTRATFHLVEAVAEDFNV